jgi:uncharacterized protein YecT (DUF1311 family)
MNTKLNQAFAELEYEQSQEEIQRVIDVLNATEKAWMSLTQADYDRIVWLDERKAIERVEFEMNGVDE